MESPQPQKPLPGAGRAPVPGWVCLVGSVLIAGHFLAISALVLGASSGPWPVDDGLGYATPPHFIQLIFGLEAGGEGIVGSYLKGIKMTHNYHFAENNVTNIEKSHFVAEFEVHLRDKDGNELKTLRFPDKTAMPIVRHRQTLLAAALNEDEIVEPRPGEFVPAPDQPIPTVRIWESVEPRRGKLGSVQEHLIPRDRPVAAPSDLAMILARSFARHLCREHDAASAEIVRYTRLQVPPDVLEHPADFPAEAFDEVTMSFGVIDAVKQN